ncbi:hypothetical protein [Actinomycetospora chiangmaiensis]|uniref:hypothetical protein n=1 Tax=Actinomycetospora chiangmaiensis TaxID=402650 RepID=UPI0012F97856|nr:hypothetical protein [Actinomycetospora chiangmaiensis]
MQTYTTPLLRSSESLERQINNLVRNVDKKWYQTSDYYKLSLLYGFGEYLYLVHAIERRFGFVAIDRSRAGRRFNYRLNGLYRAVTSFRYFRWSDDEGSVADSAIPRRMLTAIGEVMASADPPGDQGCMLFTEFCIAHQQDAQFRRWFADLDNFLIGAESGSQYYWDRLIAAEANLRLLVRELDRTKVTSSRQGFQNLDKTVSREVRDLLEAELLKQNPGLGVKR